VVAILRTSLRNGEKNIRVHVKLSFGERKFPDGQLPTQEPFDNTNPGRHVAHCNWLMVDATLKLGIPQEVHLAGQPVLAIRSDLG
jgi:hypothetical protein